MKFFIDGRQDIRPLNSQDITHRSLAYAGMSVSRGIGALDIDGLDSHLFTATDWGTGLRFFPLFINFDFYMDVNNPLTESEDGFHVRLTKIGSYIFFNQVLTNQNLPAVSYAVGVATRYRFGDTFILPEIQLLATETLRCEFRNTSGQDFGGISDSLVYNIIGVAIV